MRFLSSFDKKGNRILEEKYCKLDFLMMEKVLELVTVEAMDTLGTHPCCVQSVYMFFVGRFVLFRSVLYPAYLTTQCILCMME